MQLCLQTSDNVNAELEGGGGRTALHVAADYGQAHVAEHLIQVRYNIIVYQQNAVVVPNCAQLGANVNARDAHGITPLLAAVWEGHTDVVKLLIAQVTALRVFFRIAK